MKIPGVVATTPFAEGLVGMIYQSKPQYPGLQGIDINRVGGVIPLDHYVQGGSFEALDDDSIILGAVLANNLGAQIGDKVEVSSPLAYEKMKVGETMLPRQLRVIGFFEFGHQALDGSVALVTLRTMQELYRPRNDGARHQHQDHPRARCRYDGRTDQRRASTHVARARSLLDRDQS